MCFKVSDDSVRILFYFYSKHTKGLGLAFRLFYKHYGQILFMVDADIIPLNEFASEFCLVLSLSFSLESVQLKAVLPTFKDW